MNKTTMHARAFDLPGWPCPPRVRDIVNTPNSWGWVYMTLFSAEHGIIQDDLGRLWAAGDNIPRPERNGNNTAQLAWTPNGLGVYVPQECYGNLPDGSMLEAIPDQWLPIAVVLDAPKTLGGES